MCFNPFGPEKATKNQAHRINEIVKHKKLNTVCGYNYVANFADWYPQFEALLPHK